MLKLFISRGITHLVDYDGYELANVGSMVVAKDINTARTLLNAALLSKGFASTADSGDDYKLLVDDYTLEEVTLDAEQAIILWEGTY